MKKHTILVLVLLITAIFSSSVSAQQNLFVKKTDSLSFSQSNLFFSGEQTRIGQTRNISLTNNSGTKTITFTVSPKASGLFLNLTAHVDKGILQIVLLDPKGVKKGNITIKGGAAENTDSSWRERVQGVIIKEFARPMPGDWSITFVAKKTTATIEVTTNEE